MTDLAKYVDQLLTAELQFRLASAVRLATSRKVQPLDLPMEWTHGSQRVEYHEVALRPDQADFAACFLHRSATYLMALAMKDAIRAVVADPKNSADSDVRGSYQIARLIRNAFSHAPFAPRWSIDPDCQAKVFSVGGFISLDTTGLQDTPLDWRHYGGPLALFRLCRFVRANILHDPPVPRAAVPPPANEIYQQGGIVLTKIDRIPPNAVPDHIEAPPGPGRDSNRSD
jgi:hypothetical protein